MISENKCPKEVLRYRVSAFIPFTIHTTCKAVRMASAVDTWTDFIISRLNCLTISEDTTLVAGGFSESFIKVWSLQGKKLLSKSEKEQGQPGTTYKKLIAHAGPVYGVSFSHDNQYLISCSEDQTGKAGRHLARHATTRSINRRENSATMEPRHIYQLGVL